MEEEGSEGLLHHADRVSSDISEQWCDTWKVFLCEKHSCGHTGVISTNPYSSFRFYSVGYLLRIYHVNVFYLFIKDAQLNNYKQCFNIQNNMIT